MIKGITPLVAAAMAILAAVSLPCHALGADALTQPSSIQAEYVSSYCEGSRPSVVVNLHINATDLGRPGILFVGMLDPDEHRVSYAVAGSNNWYEYSGEALYPPYAVVTGGLQDVALRLAAGPAAWKLYLGYGALTERSESMVQAAMDVVAKARERGRANVPTVDPNHYRRALVQQDMERNGKFIHVLTWGPDNLAVCTPDTH